MVPSFRRLLRSDAGATAIEYSLIAGMIALVIISVVALTGTNLQALLAGLTGSL